MSIMQIEDYSLQAPELGAANVVGWEQSDKRSILLVHDMQKYFLNLLPPGMREKLVSTCKDLVVYAREHDIPVVYTAQCGDMTEKERGLLFDFWGKGMSRIDEHTDIVEEIAPRPDDIVLPKWRYSAFHNTSLDECFLSKEKDQMIVCGVFAHIGVLASAIDAYSRDIEVFLLQDAVAAFSKDEHEKTLKYAAQCCAKVIPCREVCQ